MPFGEFWNKIQIMKKALKYLGIALAGILLILLCIALFVNFKSLPNYEVNPPTVLIDIDSTSIARGKKFAKMVCRQCHLGDDGKLSGRELLGLTKEVGPTFSANITNHKTNGIGQYSDGELVYLLRTGIKRDGKLSPPWMPKFPNMADEDLHDIIAFLRSGDPLVSASEVQQPPSQPNFLLKALSNFAFKPIEMPSKTIVAPNKTDQVAYGKYMMNSIYVCFDCHSASFSTVDLYTPENSEGYYGGGNAVENIYGELIASANLTPHETGLKGWTKEEFQRAVMTGQRPDGTALDPAMQPFTLLTDEEISAMWAYLQTVPAIDHEVVRGKIKE